MTEGIEAITTAALGLALDAATLRQQAIAANIANANTAGYHPVSVNFESQLEDARMALQNEGRMDAASLAGVTPRLEVDLAPQALGLSPKVMVDVEVAHMAQNAVQYQALIRGLSKHFAIMSAAVSDGKK
ncbi:MAG TPA: flagellar basal body rod protein FlgB [Geothrix sp.]|nr:flagellar basal body rod protein FlgB [Geothrix sp.]